MLATLTQAVLPLAQPRYIKASAIVALLVVATVPLELSVKPVSRPFRLDNPHIAYPMVREHVPVGLLVIFAIFVPFGGIVASGLHSPQFRPLAAIAAVGFLLSVTGAMFVTDCLKLIIGNHRPDFLARCVPKEGLPRHKLLSMAEACTNSNWAVVIEGCKSTPSGHSALAFAGLLFLSLCLQTAYQTRVPKPVCFTPLLLAFYTAFTRIIDHRHHWLDIISGSIIGSLIAYIAFILTIGQPREREAVQAEA